MNYSDPVERLRAPYRLVMPKADARVLEVRIRTDGPRLTEGWRGGETRVLVPAGDALSPEHLTALGQRFDLILLHGFLDALSSEAERNAWLAACAQRLNPGGVLAANLINPLSLARLGGLLRHPDRWGDVGRHPLRRLRHYRMRLAEAGLTLHGPFALDPSPEAPVFLTPLASPDYAAHRRRMFGLGYTPRTSPSYWIKDLLVRSGLSRLTEPGYFFWAARHAGPD